MTTTTRKPIRRPDTPNIVWALPESLELPLDRLEARLDFYGETILLHLYRYREGHSDGTVATRPVSAEEVARAFHAGLRFHSGVLPPNALWWSSGSEGAEVALWRPPRVWKVALVEAALTAPRRFTLPMPGLVFVCRPAQPPRVYAARTRPATLRSPLYQAPLFDLYKDGHSCSGTHRYPDDVGEIPESFFMSFFTRAHDYQGRSRKYPDDLLPLWEELNGKRHYPMDDLMPFGTVADVMKVEEK